MLSRTYAKYISSYFLFLVKNVSQYNSHLIYELWKTMKSNTPYYCFFLFWHMIPLLHFLNLMTVYFKISCSSYLCVLGDCLNPPLPSRTSLPPTLVIWFLRPARRLTPPHPVLVPLLLLLLTTVYSQGYCCNCRCSSCKVVSPTHPGPCCIPDHTRGCISSPNYLQTKQIPLSEHSPVITNKMFQQT